MKVLVDTPIWSLAFRRKHKINFSENVLVNNLVDLIKDHRAFITGPIRQEILSGISNKEQFRVLKEKLKAFKDVDIKTAEYELAAEFSNKCRIKGIQGSSIDFLICSLAHNNKMQIFTSDKDFDKYSKHLKISLYK